MSRLHRRSLAVLIGILLSVPLSAGGAIARAASPAFHAPDSPGAVIGRQGTSNRLIVRFRGAPDDTLAAARAAGGEIVRTDARQGFVVVRAPRGSDRSSLAERLREETAVAGVGLDRVVRGALVPDDPAFPEQWGLAKIGCPAAWDVTTGSAATVVAVIDSGVDLSHPDLSGRLVGGYNVLDPSATPQDDHGHGTEVAGVAAAQGGNGVDGSGVAPNARIMPVKVLASDGTGNDSDVITAIRWAADHGARVINMSLGGPGAPDPVTDGMYRAAISYARGKGTVIVAAAGNDGSDEVFYPAAYPGIIAVGATDENDVAAGFSNYGSDIDVSAPGVAIRSTSLGGGTAVSSGTSLAAPFVSGLAALELTKEPRLTPDLVEQEIRATSVDLGDPGRDDLYGSGRISAGSAMLRARPRVVSARPMNPVAYELKSLLTTRFRATVDTNDVWAELKVKTPKGDRFLYKGPIKAAGIEFEFPAWNGTGPDGKRLPSASYDWQLTVGRGGLWSITSGKITVSRIYFKMSGTSVGGVSVRHQGYMIPGNVNCYVSASTTASSDGLRAVLSGPAGYRTNVGQAGFGAAAPLSATWYVRPPFAVRSRAIHTFDVTGDRRARYDVIVIQ